MRFTPRTANKLITLTLLILVWGRDANAVLGTLALTPSESVYGGIGDDTRPLSFAFQVSTTINVTALANHFHTDWPQPANAHFLVSLAHWNGVSLDSPIASTIVDSGSPVFQSSHSHNFLYEPITPVTLTAGNTYVLSSTEEPYGSFFYNFYETSADPLLDTIAHGPEIIFYGSYMGYNPVNTTTTATWSYFGPDLFYVTVTPTVPSLSIINTTTNSVVVFWPSPSSGFSLYQNSNVNSTNWTLVSPPPMDDGTNKWVVVNSPTDSRYYRLINP